MDDTLKWNATPYLSDANEVVNFHIIRSEADFANRHKIESFHPDMSHQIFGEKEQIFGYTNLKINLYYIATTLQCFVEINYKSKMAKTEENIEADNIQECLNKALTPTNYLTNINQFSMALQEHYEFKPFGVKVHAYSRTCRKTQQTRNYEVYMVEHTTSKFRSYHERMESFILWFIDAASQIDADDPKWNFFVIYEKYKESDGTFSYHFVGYTTIYKFYAYPDKIRPRISQVLILPPHQRKGHCAELLKVIYQQYVNLPNVLDMTAEDPSENFQRVRDFVDCSNCATLQEFQPGLLVKGFSKKMLKVAHEKFKINKKQAGRVYEILRLQSTNVNNLIEYAEYKDYLRKRIDRPLRNIAQRKRLLAAHHQLLPSLEERRTIIDNELAVCLEEYEKVVQRLDNC